MNIFDFTFWQDFVSNLLSTIIGVALGIPVAFWINKRVEYKTEIERKNKILTNLREELEINQNVFNDWEENNQSRYRQITQIYGEMLCDEVWNTFSDGGELQWIKDISLLGTLALTYGEIKRLKYLHERYFYRNPLSEQPDAVIDKNLSGIIRNAQMFIKESLSRIEGENIPPVVG